MKSLIYWGIIAYLFYTGVTNFYSLEEGDEPLEISFLNGEFEGFSLDFMPSFEGGKMITADQWSDVLIGEWEYRSHTETPSFIIIKTGTIEYKEDSTFIKRILIKYYKSNTRYIEESSEYLKLVAGGQIKGEWGYRKKDNTEVWFEMPKDCNYDKGKKNTYEESEFIGKSVCDYYDIGVAIDYGNFEEDFAESRVELFSKNKILAKTTFFAEERVVDYEFKRIK